ncbi:DMT family transporter [Streptomyces sp. NPDC003077]|uniref:DMT family transporter n=1 Tax=Streptomyces sp. NPDC003077 TaxID=3154443 RepID=UPI0033A8A21D
MSPEPSTRLVSGVVPLVAFAALTALVDVYAGNRLQSLSPLGMAAVSFTLAAAFFLGLEVTRKGVPAALRPLRSNRADVVAINISTAVTWLSMLYALKYLEPAVVNVVGLAIGPVFALLLNPLLRKGTAILASEVAVSLGIGVFIGVLVWGSVTGRTGVAPVGAGDALLGIGLTLLCGLGSTGNVIFSKRLSESGYAPQSVLSVRFFLAILVTWAAVAVSEDPQVGSVLLPGLIIAVIGVGVPLYVLQVGIKHTEPITASLLCTLSPLFAFLLQLPDDRLTVSGLTLVSVLGITALVGLGTLARGRYDRRQAAAKQRPETVPARPAPADPTDPEVSSP